MTEVLLFIATGIVGGIVNAAAGGAKLFVFPMLLAAGMPPLVANATGTVALWPAQVAAVWVNRAQLRDAPRALFFQMLPGLIGALLGAIALTQTSETGFLAVIPILLVLAVAAIILGKQMSEFLTRLFPADTLKRAAAVLLFGVGFYGGYFGAGLGFMLIAVLSIAGGLSLQMANTRKNLFSFFINSTAVIPLGLSGLVNWPAAGAVLVGGIFGGWLGGHLTRSLPDLPMRIGVAALGVILVVSFLFQ